MVTPSYSTDKYYADVKTRAPAAKAVGAYNRWLQSPRGKELVTSPAAQAYNAQFKANYNSMKGAPPGSAKLYTDWQIQQLGKPQPTPFAPPSLTGTGSSGGSRGGYGGGGGGGGGVDAAAAAQSQMDYLTQLLGGKSWTAPRMDALRQANEALRTSVTNATAADQASANTAYNALDQYLAANQSNPYANVQLQNARFAPAQNAYLSSQGLSGMNDVQANPEDVGANAAFGNVLKLLGAGQQASAQSRGAESQMGRTFVGQQIGAMDNAYLAQIAQRDADVAAKEQEAQMGLDAEKRKIMLELAALVGQGAKQPDLAALGLA